MRADHHDFVLQIRAGNFRDSVVGHEIVAVKLHLKISGNFQLLALLDHAHQPIVIFHGDCDLRWHRRGVGGPDCARTSGTCRIGRAGAGLSRGSLGDKKRSTIAL